MPKPKQYANAHERRRAANQRRRIREGWAAKPKPATAAPLPVVDAIARYRLEKAKSDERRAPARAAELQKIKAAIARADDERTQLQRGGRPKRLLALNLHADPANALLDALGSGK